MEKDVTIQQIERKLQEMFEEAQQRKPYNEYPMTVDHFVDLVIEEASRIDGDGGFYRKHLFEALDFSYGNSHLSNILNRLPTNHPAHKYWTQDREEPLTGKEVMYGKYLVFDYIGHNGQAYAVSYESMEKLEEAILDFVDNEFVSYQIAIIEGKLKRYTYNETTKKLEWE